MLLPGQIIWIAWIDNKPMNDIYGEHLGIIMAVLPRDRLSIRPDIGGLIEIPAECVMACNAECN